MRRGPKLRRFKGFNVFLYLYLVLTNFTPTTISVNIKTNSAMVRDDGLAPGSRAKFLWQQLERLLTKAKKESYTL